ncbi:hypothetical protein GCM10010207_77990 [Streptomyces atratus]|nr:hypothetical protein GCM10010207_77990 [Streptomyces atratus]
MTGDSTAGIVIQSGSITGGVHYHRSPPAPPLPRQLPALPVAWVDREADHLLLHSKSSDSPPDFGSRLIVLSGQDGIGTTTLASRLLHELQDRFRGGSLYVDLRGHEPEGPLPGPPPLGQILEPSRPTRPSDGHCADPSVFLQNTGNDG